MIEKIRKEICEYVTCNSNMNNWQCVRENYFYASYVTFLVLALNDLNDSLENIKDSALAKNLEDKVILDFVLSLPGMDAFIEELIFMVKLWGKVDINAIYQEYLSVDYIIDNDKITFSGGKNGRDVIGAYYTQKEFAYEVVKKNIDDYIKYNGVTIGTLRVIDIACGGGAFLTAAYEYCTYKNIKIALFGIDIDPIACVIARTALFHCCKDNDIVIDIRLGNPLLCEVEKRDNLDVFKIVSTGRFYNKKVGLNIQGKYDVVVGNPPWEKIRFEEKKFLQHYITTESLLTKIERSNIWKNISKDNQDFYEAIYSDYEWVKKDIKGNIKFNYTNCSELNTYALFTELSLGILNEKGNLALIVKASLVKIPTYSKFMKYVLNNKYLYEAYMFVNRKKIFNIDSREEFSILYLRNHNNTVFKIILDLEEYNKFYDQPQITLPYEVIQLINPETGTIPNIKTNEELQFLIDLYGKYKVFSSVYADCYFGRLVHLTNHSNAIVKCKQKDYSAIYEGKFIELYTGKYATFNGISEVEKYKNKAKARLIEEQNSNEYPESRYYIEDACWKKISRNFQGDYVIAWRSLTSSTNRRTMLSTILPLIPTCQSIQMLQIENSQTALHILALFNSIIFDYIIRLKMVGLDLTQTIIKQIPVPDDSGFSRRIMFHDVEASISEHVNSRLYMLYYHDARIKGAFIGIKKYNIVKYTERKKLIAEIDVLIAILYGMNQKTLSKIAQSFGKFYTKEEIEMWF